MPIGPTEFDMCVPALLISRFLQAMAKCIDNFDVRSGGALMEEADHRLATLARAPQPADAAAAPPRSVMNSRRFIIRSPHRRGRAASAAPKAERLARSLG